MRALFDPKELEPTGKRHRVVPSSKFDASKIYDTVFKYPNYTKGKLPTAAAWSETVLDS